MSHVVALLLALLAATLVGAVEALYRLVTFSLSLVLAAFAVTFGWAFGAWGSINRRSR